MKATQKLLQIRPGVFTGIGEVFFFIALGLLWVALGVVTVITTERYIRMLELQTVKLVKTDIENAMVMARDETLRQSTGYADLLAGEAPTLPSPGVISLEYDLRPPISGFNHFVLTKDKGLVFQRFRIPHEVLEAANLLVAQRRPWELVVSGDRLVVLSVAPVKGTDWFAGFYLEIHPGSLAESLSVSVRKLSPNEPLPSLASADAMKHKFYVFIRDSRYNNAALVTISTRGLLASLRKSVYWTYSFLLFMVGYGIYFLTRNVVLYYGVSPVQQYVERLRESMEKGEVFRKMETTGEPGLDALGEEITALVNRMRETQMREIAQLKELRFVQRLSESLLRVTSRRELAQILVEEVQRAIGRGAVVLRLLREDQKILECAAHIGIPDELIEEAANIPAGKGLSGRVLISGTPLFIEDYNNSEMRLSARPTPFYYGYCAPIRSGSEIIGTLSVFTPQEVPIVLSMKRTLEIATTEFGVVFRGLSAVLKLRELKDFNDQVLENMSEGLLVESLDGSIEYVNPFLLRLLGVRSRSAVIGKRWESWLSDEDRQKIESLKEKSSDLLLSYEARLRPDEAGLQRTVRITSTYLAGETGPAKRLSVVADITDLKDRETIIDRHRQFLLALTNALPAAVVVLNRKGQIVFCNSAFRDHFCLGQGEVLKNVVRGEIAEKLEEILETGVPVSGIEFEQVMGAPSRGKRYWRLSALNLPDRDEVLFVFVDVTNERDLARKIAETEKLILLGEMLTKISHQVNNPLTGIIGNAELLLMDSKEGSEQYEAVSLILKSADRIRQVLRSLEIFSRPAGTGMSYFSLAALVKDVVAISEHSLSLKGIRLATDLDPNMPEMLGDPFQIRQALFNLITNSEQAYEETKRQGTIVVQTKWLPETKEALLSVQDEAGGMSEVVRQRALEPFFSTRPPDRAAGMGLPLVYGIVRAHKGSLDIQSEKGKGTTVTLRFPVEPRPKADEARAAQMALDEASLANLRILLVEDETEVRVPVKRFLEAEGALVEDAPDGHQALNLLAIRDYSIILLDLRLPDCDGIEIIHHLSRTRPGLLRGVMVITGLNVAPEEQAFLRSKRIPCLQKPFSMTDLKKKILERLYGDIRD